MNELSHCSIAYRRKNLILYSIDIILHETFLEYGYATTQFNVIIAKACKVRKYFFPIRVQKEGVDFFHIPVGCRTRGSMLQNLIHRFTICFSFTVVI